MRLVRIGLGSIDTTVGAFRENTDRALVVARQMADDGVTIGLFPEQAIGGYLAGNDKGAVGVFAKRADRGVDAA